jgi:hypothetical protein
MNPDGFKDPYIIEDINIYSTDKTLDRYEFESTDGTLNRYEFEGYIDDPSAFIEFWEIIACSFELQVE